MGLARALLAKAKVRREANLWTCITAAEIRFWNWYEALFGMDKAQVCQKSVLRPKSQC
jgi:hypothetical protein